MPSSRSTPSAPGSRRCPGVREVLHARHVEHAYPVHTHDVWTLLLVDQGAIRYDLDRHAQGAEPSMVSILPPHIVHDGRPATADGYRKRVIYLEPAVIGESLIGVAVDRPVLPDPGLRAAVSELDRALGCVDDALEAETRLHAVAERIRRAMGGPRTEERPDPRAGDAAVEALPRLPRRPPVRARHDRGRRRDPRRRADPPRPGLHVGLRDRAARLRRRPAGSRPRASASSPASR